MELFKMKSYKLILSLGALMSTFCMSEALAGSADYVYTPMVEQGEKEIDFKFGTAKQQDGSHQNVTSLGLGYGVNEFWFTEVYLKRESEAGEGLTIAEWENKFQLTETGKYPIEIGLITEFEAPTSNKNEPYEFKFGPLFQTEFGKLQLNANILFERKFGPSDFDDSRFTEMGYQWQAKYRLQPSFELGMQGMGELGKWNDWSSTSDQNHRFGPAVFGKVSVGDKQAIKYNAAWLFGVSDAAPNNTFRMQVEYEF
jgi:hypothetical protein